MSNDVFRGLFNVVLKWYTFLDKGMCSMLKFKVLLNKLVILWDPDFTRLTFEGRKRIKEADAEFKKGEYISEEDFWK